MNRRHILFASIVAVSLIAASAVSAQTERRNVHAPETLPGVEPAMLTADYWVALQKDADDVIMTSEQIKAFNEQIRTKKIALQDRHGKPDPMISFYDFVSIKGLLMNPILPMERPDTVPGDSVRVRLNRNAEWLYDPMPLWGSKDFFDGRNVVYDKKMKDELVARMNIAAIPNAIRRRFGIVVNHVNARYYPTDVPGYQNPTSECDRFQAGSILIGTPVAILHESTDGDYLYVETPESRCWIDARDIAIGSRNEVKKLAGDPNFLMAAGHRVVVYTDPAFKTFARYFYYSATMPLVKRNASGYTVKMPFRNEDGSIGTINGYVRPDADVHIGYYPYTKRNVLTQVFKLMDQPYGWEDQDDKRDCCGTMHVLLRCFGIQTGRWCNHILLASDNRFYMNPQLTTEQKLTEAAKLEPVITMAGTSGHIVLYLGTAANGKQYFIHQAGWGYNEGDTHYWVNRHTINELTQRWYSVDSPSVWTTFRP